MDYAEFGKWLFLMGFQERPTTISKNKVVLRYMNEAIAWTIYLYPEEKKVSYYTRTKNNRDASRIRMPLGELKKLVEEKLNDP